MVGVEVLTVPQVPIAASHEIVSGDDPKRRAAFQIFFFKPSRYYDFFAHRNLRFRRIAIKHAAYGNRPGIFPTHRTRENFFAHLLASSYGS
jgi:hypothetical protein